MDRSLLSKEFQHWLKEEQAKGLVDVKASINMQDSDVLNTVKIADALMNAHKAAHDPSYKPQTRDYL
jgi:hypothetical protein